MWGNHQGLEWCEGRELGVCSLKRPMRQSSDRVIQSSTSFREGHGGGVQTLKSLMRGNRFSESVNSYLRWGGASYRDGDASSMVMGTWSEPVERRKVSHPFTKGRTRGEPNARSITEGRAFPLRGNLVYTPGEWSKAKPPSAASSK